jgi:hypothetical protein
MEARNNPEGGATLTLTLPRTERPRDARDRGTRP